MHLACRVDHDYFFEDLIRTFKFVGTRVKIEGSYEFFVLLRNNIAAFVIC